VICDGGRCDNGQSCNPSGNICGAAVLPGGGSINASQNFCDGRQEVCRLDSAGIPRCYGGQSADCPEGLDSDNPLCCIAAGDVCQFREQCCGGTPCLPDPAGTGALVCSAQSCTPVGDPCTEGSTDECCEGTECLTTGELGFACQVPGGGGGGSGGGGAGGGGGSGACSGNGAACTDGADCCSSICVGGTCATPSACQPQDGVCTATADCCLGLSCAVPQAGGAGTCQPGATCSGLGQACSATIACCAGTQCVDPGGSPCQPNVSCSCFAIFE
jgi:hypothetical protein